MMASRRLVVLFLISTLLDSGVGLSTRRAVLSHAVAAAAVSLPPLAADAAQRGAENAYQTQTFGSEVCVRRTPLGACAETAPGQREAPAQAPLKVLKMEPEPESELVKRLLQKSEVNKEANERLVLEKTIKAGQAGQFGPFSNEAPIMRQDGTFDVVSVRRFDKLKDRGKLTKTATGLDQYVAGFDPDAVEPKSKFLGIF